MRLHHSYLSVRAPEPRGPGAPCLGAGRGRQIDGDKLKNTLKQVTILSSDIEKQN